MREEKELRNLFNRILFVSVFGVVAAHLSYFKNPICISFHSVAITLAMKRYDIGVLFEKIAAVCSGLFLGILATELFIPFPHLESLLVYIIFLTTLKLFAHDYKPNTVFLFNFSFMYTSIFGSYLEAGFDTETMQLIWQMILWVSIIITVTFKLFPSRMEVVGVKPLKNPRVKRWEICFFSLILTIIWSFSMIFEWRFAFFAYVSLISLFTGFETKTMGFKAMENIKVHFKACSITAAFSLLLYGMVQNIALLTLALLLVFLPVVRDALYPRDPKRVYGNLTLISGLIFPLTIYINLDGAAVYQSLLRSLMITFLMVFILFIIRLLPYNRLS